MDDGFARFTVRQQMVLFVPTPMVTVIWFEINILHICSRTFGVVRERFAVIAVPKTNAGLAALTVASSGPLWAHHKRKAANSGLLDFFFRVCFVPRRPDLKRDASRIQRLKYGELWG